MYSNKTNPTPSYVAPQGEAARAQPQGEWSGITATNLESPSVYHLMEAYAVKVELTDVPTALATLQRGLKAMNVEADFRADGHADLRSSKDDTFHVATWAPSGASEDRKATIEIQSTSTRQDYEHNVKGNFIQLLTGTKTVEDLEQEHETTPLTAANAQGLIQFESALNRIIGEHGQPIPDYMRNYDPAQMIHQTLQTRGEFGVYEVLPQLSLHVDASKMTSSSVASFAAKVVGQPSDDVSRSISSAVKDTILAHAESRIDTTNVYQSDDSIAPFGIQRSALQVQGPIHHALETLSKSLDARATLSQPVTKSTPVLGDDIKNDRFLSALVKIAGAPSGQQHLSTLALNSLNTLIKDDDVVTRVQALPGFIPAVTAARTFAESSQSTNELGQAVNRLATTAGLN